MPEVTDRPAAPLRLPNDGARRDAGGRSALVPVAALFALAVAVYAFLALRSPLPSLFPDEYRYAHLARGLADGTGFSWHGVHVDQTAALYVYVITPVWALWHSTVDAYAATKVLGTILLCAQLVPVWLLGRDLLGSARLALLPAALSVAGTWMLAGATAATEALALPLTTTSLCLTVLALRRGSQRLGLLAVGCALLAAWARIQLAVLIPVLLAIFALDLLRLPAGERRAALHARRTVLAVLGGLTLLGLAVAVAFPGAAGDYQSVFDFRPGAGKLLRKSGLQLLELVALTGFVPALLGAGALTSPRALRDDRIGPLLITFWLAALGTAVQSGFYLASDPAVATGIDRYVAYAAPLSMVLVVVLIREARLVGRRAFAVAGVLALTLLAAPGSAQMAIERAVWSTSYRVHQVAGLSHGAALLAAALALLAIAFALRERLADPARAAVAVGCLVLAVFAVQGEAAWKQHIDLTRSFRATFPADLQWVDHHSHGDVAWLGATVSTPKFAITDFFNRHISRAYVPATGLPGRVVPGGQCAWQVQARTGALQFQPNCQPSGGAFLVDDPTAELTLSGARAASDPRLGDVAEVPRGTAPRARSIVYLPCPRLRTPVYSTTSPEIRPAGAAQCNPQLSGQLWLDAPGRLAITFHGGTADHAVSVGSQTWDVPAGRDTTVSLKAPAGPSQFNLTLDWTSDDPANPRLGSVGLHAGGRVVPLIS